MAKTGETCTQSGVYRCSDHPHYEIPLSKGERFPPCNNGGKGHSTTWVLVRAA